MQIYFPLEKSQKSLNTDNVSDNVTVFYPPPISFRQVDTPKMRILPFHNERRINAFSFCYLIVSRYKYLQQFIKAFFTYSPRASNKKRIICGKERSWRRKINSRYACTKRRKSRRSISFNIYIVEMKQNDDVGEWKKKTTAGKEIFTVWARKCGKGEKQRDDETINLAALLRANPEAPIGRFKEHEIKLPRTCSTTVKNNARWPKHSHPLRICVERIFNEQKAKILIFFVIFVVHTRQPTKLVKLFRLNNYRL